MINISENSIFLKICRIGDKNYTPRNLCEYFWKGMSVLFFGLSLVLAPVFFIGLLFTLSIMDNNWNFLTMFSGLILLIGCLIIHLVLSKTNPQKVGLLSKIVLVPIGIIPAILNGFVAIFVIMLVNFIRCRKLSDSLFIQWLKAKKGKYCPMIKVS